MVIISLAWSCINTPEFSDIPEIKYNSVFFKKGALTDSLLVSINFQDGDGDLGLDPAYDIGEPYHAIWYFKKSDNTFLTYADRNTPSFDTLPPYNFPYFCYNYSIENSDTFYIQQNTNHYNIFLNFYVKKNGEFKLYDWLLANPPECGESYNGRFPLLNLSDKARPLEGKLTYKVTGAGFEVIFKRDTLKLEIQIQDRALNRSNIVESQEFVLKDITIN